MRTVLNVKLKDVYGDSVDKIVQGNTSNIVFLKSTDDSMLETLQKMSGTTHRSYIDQKTVTRDMEKLMLANEGKASYMMQTKEVPVISYNDMAFIAERNSIVFRAGDPPIWNRNETILPMSWRLFSNTIEQPGRKFTLQTIPTLSSAIDFDLKKNQPDFNELLKVRMQQASLSASAAEAYKQAFDYDDDDIHRLDIDVYAGDVMDMVTAQMARDRAQEEAAAQDAEDAMLDAMDEEYMNFEDNDEVQDETEKRQAEKDARDRKIYAHGHISRSDLVTGTGVVNHQLDGVFQDAYKQLKADMARDTVNFSFGNDCLCSKNGAAVYISQVSRAEAEDLREAASESDTRVYADQDISDQDLDDFVSYEISDDFYRFLAELPSWSGIARGKFEEAVTRLMDAADAA